MSTKRSVKSRWQPIETAPKDIVWKSDNQGYGPSILAYPVWGEVARVRWWESLRETREEDRLRFRNFLDDGGNAAMSLTHWMPLPQPPKGTNR